MTGSQIIDSLILTGKSDKMHQLYKMIGRVCNLDCPVLLIGERGSGKGHVARALHFFSQRAGSPFYFIRGSRDTERSDEQFLGIEESQPPEGTCYITNYTAMPVLSQYQLLSIHQRKRFKSSHAGELRSHNLRFIVGAGNTFRDELESGTIPPDLFYDWNFLPLYIPPLRDRKEDIPLHANHFLELLSAEMKVTRKELSPEAMEILIAHEWPGNLTELKGTLRTALSNCRGNYIRAEHLPSLKRQGPGDSEAFERLEFFLNSKLSSYIQHSPDMLAGNLYRMLLPQIEKSLFDYALDKSKGNRNKAAQLLGLHRNTLNKKLQKLM